MSWIDGFIDNLYAALPVRAFGPFSESGSLFNVVVSSMLLVGFVWMTVAESFDWSLVPGVVIGIALVTVFVRVHIRSRRGDFLP